MICEKKKKIPHVVRRVYKSFRSFSDNYQKRDQGWLSGESRRIQPIVPGFKSRHRHHPWVKVVFGCPRAPIGFSPDSPVFLSTWRLTLSNSNLIWKGRALSIRCSRKFSTGATRKTVFQFLFIRIFRKLLVNGKQPKDSPVPDPEVGWEGGGGVRPSGPSPGSTNVHIRFRIQFLWTHDQTKPFIFRIPASACAPQNESGTATFQNRDEIKAEKSPLVEAWT